jgi:glycosyltransferase involved in cell wall biosynthesis
MKKLAIITSHPIQYNAPLFKKLEEESEVELMVFYTWGKDGAKIKYDPGFNREIEWDLPLLEGYNYQFCINVSKEPGSHHFSGIKTPKLISQIEEWGADIIWVWGWAFHSHLAVLRHFKGKTKIWFRGDSTLLDEALGFSIKKLVRKLFLKWVYSHVDEVFYVGTNNKNYFLKFGLKENQLVLAPHSVDNARFERLTETGYQNLAELRESLELVEDDFVLLFAGKLEMVKNPQFLIYVIKLLGDTKVKVVFVGNGHLEAELKSLAPPEVKFLNFQNQTLMPIVYRLADLFVLPSMSETWGLAINESLASGIPVAASIYCGGSVDLINSDNGFLFDPKNGPEIFIEKLKQFRKQEKKDFIFTFKDYFSYERIIEAVKENLN